MYHTRGQVGRRYTRGAGDELVLSDVNIAVAPGEMVYLIGKVGSGKSTLLKTLYGEVPLYEGQGRIVDFDLRKLRRRDIPYLRRKIGVVFQDYQLLTDRNVFQNLHYVMSATGWREEIKMRRRIEEVLSLVGLTNKEYKMPFQLSGGEQQRLAIARALINSPQVILADEPTGNLDPAAAEGIMTLFRYIVHSGTSIVMSTHNIGNIQSYPSRTLRFSAGAVEEIDIRSILGITE
ncbi:MAG: ATP-binding cassette domain-containing protein [Rikenellaceae bacterium]|nr:ATP-binding cassette domain-containing protein [Rikenellaceae bacterium]